MSMKPKSIILSDVRQISVKPKRDSHYQTSIFVFETVVLDLCFWLIRLVQLGIVYIRSSAGNLKIEGKKATKSKFDFSSSSLLRRKLEMVMVLALGYEQIIHLPVCLQN